MEAIMVMNQDMQKKKQTKKAEQTKISECKNNTYSNNNK